MKILVIGGAGFIGSFVVDALLQKGHQVVVYDNFEPQVHTQLPDYLNPKAKIIVADINDRKKLEHAVVNSDIIFHFAARVGVGQSMYEINDYAYTNQQGTALLLDILANAKHQVQKVIVASSMSIYGEGSYTCKQCQMDYHDVVRKVEHTEKKVWDISCPNCKSILEPIPTNEDKITKCDSVYALTKKNQEEMTLCVCKAYNIPAVALRFFNCYGPRQSLSNPYTGVAAIFMSRIKNNNSPLIFEDGQQARDFVSVHDLVQACLLVMEKNQANGEVYNVGSGEKITIEQVAKTLLEVMNSDLQPTITTAYRKGDIRHCFADISKIKKIGYEPKVSFKEGMKELVLWAKDQEAKDAVDEAFELMQRKKLI